MQSVIYRGDVCGISLQFCRERHVLDINSLLTLICVVLEQTFHINHLDINLIRTWTYHSGEHHTIHTVECELTLFDIRKI